ncbi:uncharacterized protein LOC127849098 [Dreissena polymorpha]|uniref:uncharacterized protein LOC127849098 n=1 Tax=Dreissena polymorpha TaxID=45954 RepID=UPI0022647EB6|nr:uncharacterized protein LOC127849098 [Dreissena polymorpha]
MAADTNIFTDKQTNNWFKACIALNLTKDGLTDLVVTELLNVQTKVGRSCGQCFIQNLIPCPTQDVCKKRKRNNCSFHNSQQPKSCQTCDKVKQNITLLHRFKGPSWANTKAELWATDPWEIGKCYLPRDGYSSVSSVQESDVNGVVSIVLNCTHFQTCLSAACLSPPPPDKQCPLEKVRQIGRDVRHTADCKVTDADLQYFFLTLTTLLADPVHLLHDTSATEARVKLSDLQNDRLSLVDLGKMLKEANQTLTHAKEAGERFSEEAERTLKEGLNTLEAKIQAGKERLENKTQTSEQRIEKKAHSGEQRIENKTQAGEQRIENKTQAGEQRIENKTQCGEQSIENKTQAGEQSITNKAQAGEQRIENKTQAGEQSIENKTQAGEQNIENKAQAGEQSIAHKTHAGEQSIEIKTQAGEQCIENKTKAGEQSIENKTQESINRINQAEFGKELDEYERGVTDFRDRLIKFYTTTKKTVPVSPLSEGRDKPISDVFVQPKLSHVTIEKDGSRKKTGNPVNQYKALLYIDEKLSSRVFVQGEPGMGKTTFLTKLALDWCDAVSEHNPDHRPTFSDVETLKEFRFLFQISLRDARDQREVIEMIKTQIIDMIYPGEVKREETVKLLPHILERETYIVSMDGLNEWVDRLNQFVIPLLAQWHSKCVSIITSRPWKMADERIKDSEIKKIIEVEGIIDTEELANKVINSLQTGNVKTTPEFMKYVNERQFGNLLKSPWLQTLLVNCWMNKTELSGSLCEINCILLDTLFKNARAKKGYFQKGKSFQCLTNTSFIQRQINIFDALANVAFDFTFSSSKSPVFTERGVLNHMSEKQLNFCLHAGVFTKRYSSNIAGQNAQFSFLHETLQEFMTAYHIANSKQDLKKQFRTGSKYNVLEMSQTIIYLCGLDCKKANTLINCLVDDEFLKAISHGVRMYIMGFYNQENLLAFQDDNGTRRNVLKSNNDNMDYGARCVALSVLFQRMIIAGCIEATASGEKEICLNCRDFIFNQNLSESDSNALERLLLYNCADVRSLIVESNCLQISEILTVILKSKHCLTRVKITMTPEISKALHHTSIQELNCIGQFDVSSCSYVLPSLSQLTYLRIEDTSFLQDISLPETIQTIFLSKCECSSEWLCTLLITLSSLDHPVECELWDVVLQLSEDIRGDEAHTHISDLRSEILSHDLSNIELFVKNGSKELFELLRDTSIRILKLMTDNCASLASEILHTLNKLTELYLLGTYTGRCDLRLPVSLQCISLPEDHPVKCELCDALQSSEDIRGDEALK